MKYTRKFLGKIGNFENKAERDFEKKHLKAYLKGHERFVDGFERGADGNVIYDKYLKQDKTVGFIARHKYYDVKQELIKV